MNLLCFLLSKKDFFGNGSELCNVILLEGILILSQSAWFMIKEKNSSHRQQIIADGAMISSL